ncbi:hypothetical protein C8R44DRAFT_880347 [Mycena epipterygia]|nr:hypothetical protein C8R44DRAFT_880347 [Mycena epipterygia]
MEIPACTATLASPAPTDDELLAACEEETGVSNKTEEEPPKNAVPPSRKAKGEKDSGDDTFLFDHLNSHIETWRKWTAINPWPRVPHIIPLVPLPSTTAAPPDPSASKQECLVYLAFRVFYVEWDCFMSPDPADPVAPATPLIPDEEAMRFNGLTFEEYALHRLHHNDDRFRNHVQWLSWVLTRTADAELAKAVNCVLVTLHKKKARHLGNGHVEVLPFDERFQQLGAKKRPKK